MLWVLMAGTRKRKKVPKAVDNARSSCKMLQMVLSCWGDSTARNTIDNSTRKKIKKSDESS